MPVSRWNYISEGAGIEHIGPMAEDFAAAFETGSSGEVIGTVDASGVALASIQALHEMIEEKDAEIERLREENEAMDARLARIEAMLNK